jgi:hypothetical protein
VKLSIRLSAVVVMLMALAAGPLRAAGPTVTIVMSGLDNPRGLAFDSDGALFVAEAGRGGAPCGPVPPGGNAFSCYGLTGGVSRLWHGHQDRIVSGLPSLSFRLGASARGPHDIVLRSGAGGGSVLRGSGADVTIGFEGDPAARGTERPDLGTLVHIPARALHAPSSHLCDHECWQRAVDIGAFEAGGGPDGKPETDPYGLLIEPRTQGDEGEHHFGRGGDDEGENDDEDDDGGDGGGRADILVDASGNSLLRVDADGEITLLADFPSRGTVPPRSVPPGIVITDSVPAALASGPDGAYYVGEIVGIPNSGKTRDRSNVYRVSREGGPGSRTILLDGHVTGFNAIIDIAFRGDDLYVLQHWTVTAGPVAHDGKLVRVSCGGTPLVCDGLHPTTVLDNLDGPTAIAFGPDGALYLSNHGASAAFDSPTSTANPIGQVLRIDLGDGAPHQDHGDH